MPEFRELTALEGFLPRVDRILAIGWRGAEKHFLTLLKKGLPQPVRIKIVSGSASAGQMTWRLLDGAGIRGEPDIFDGGFTEFVATRAGDPLFRT